MDEIAGPDGGMRLRRVIAGEGMVEATVSFLAVYDGQVTEITAGQSRAIPDHELVERNPLAWVAADSSDPATRQAHAEAIVRYLERECA